MSELGNKFWNILDRVRGQRDIRDLKELFISLVFLKYANDRCVVNEYNTVKVPRHATWNYLYENLNNYDFAKSLEDAFLSLERENPQLESTFSVFNFRQKFNKEKDSELIKYLFGSLIDFDFFLDSLGFSNIAENLLINFAKNEGKKGADFTTPNSVSQLMINLLNPEQGTILDSACGTGGFFQKIKDKYPKGNFKFYGQEYNLSTLALAKLRFAFNQDDRIRFGEANNTLIEDQFPDLKADYVVMHPPFNLKSWFNNESHFDPRFEFGLPPNGNANLAWIQHAIFHLNSNGKAAVLLSNSSLSTSGKEGEIRKNLIEADLVEAIITLPSQLLSNTSIPTSIWFLNKNKIQKEKVLFIDATDLGHKMQHGAQHILDKKSINEISSQLEIWQENSLTFSPIIGFSNSIDLKEIAKHDYLLVPARYVGFKESLDIDLSNALALKDVLEDVRPSSLESNIPYKRVSIKDLSSNQNSYLLNSKTLTEGEHKLNYKLLQKDVLLFSRLGKNLKPTYYKASKAQLAYSANVIYAFKVKTNLVSLDYLIAELHKDYIQFQLDSYRKGAGMPIVRRQDLLNIKIIIPNLLEKQKEIFEEERELRFQSLTKDLGFEKEIEKLKKAQMKDLGSKKHNIMQHLNNVKASADVLTKMMELNNGILKSDEIIDPRRGVTVEKRFLRLQESLDKVIYYVDNITNELKYNAAEIIDPTKFIKECKERGLQNDLFSVEVIVENATFLGRKPLISISKNDFEELYNNILENAINHGFVDKNKSYIFRVSIAYIEDSLEINFVNNGKPFPKGIAAKFDVKGEKAGVTAGTGIGLWKVAEIAKHFNCKLEVFDEPTNEFPVGFKFQFNLETL